jgi:polyisoprenoid-binding protein YceI
MKTPGFLARCERQTATAAAALMLFPAISSAAADKAIDANTSVITIHVGKAGLFSAAGHEHWVDAPVSHGHFSEGAGAHIVFVVDAHKMTVRPDEKTSDKDRTTIQETMQSSVLESDKYPEIRFHSTNATQIAKRGWRVTGTLTLHGVSRVLAVEVQPEGDAYVGSARLKQTDFGIQPVRIAGGVVKVKDELDISFKIHTAAK